MTSTIIARQLESLKAATELDAEFIDILVASNTSNEEGKATAQKILELISQRYAASKENHT